MKRATELRSDSFVALTSRPLSSHNQERGYQKANGGDHMPDRRIDAAPRQAISRHCLAISMHSISQDYAYVAMMEYAIGVMILRHVSEPHRRTRPHSRLLSPGLELRDIEPIRLSTRR